MFSIKKPFLIGETAFHHEGDINFLKKLIDAGLDAGVDTLKFHLLFDLDDYFVKSHKAFKVMENFLISKSNWEQLHKDLIKRKIKPVYLCNDLSSLKWVNSLEKDSVLAIEIHATGINDLFLLEEATKFSGTVILGVGGSTFDDVHYAIDFLKSKNKFDILLMHGFQNYPTLYSDVVFSRMTFFKSAFNLPIGYADHTDPDDSLNEYISSLPQAMGFNILEKHFTITPGEKKIDSQAAVTINQLKEIRRLIDLIFSTYGEDALKFSTAEKKYGDTGPMKKAIVASKPILKGQILSLKDIAFKRTNESVPLKQRDLHLLIGRKAMEDIDTDTPLTFNNISYSFKEAANDQFFLNKT